MVHASFRCAHIISGELATNRPGSARTFQIQPLEQELTHAIRFDRHYDGDRPEWLNGIAAFAMDKMQNVYAATAKKMSRMRQAMSEGGSVDNTFTDEERQEML